MKPQFIIAFAWFIIFFLMAAVSDGPAHPDTVTLADIYGRLLAVMFMVIALCGVQIILIVAAELERP